MTLINVLPHINNNSLNIIMNNEPKQIELGDLKYEDEECNACLIEIKDNNKDNIQYMEIDENIFKSELEMNYYKESIYVIQYNNKTDNINLKIEVQKKNKLVIYFEVIFTYKILFNDNEL